MTLSAPPHNAAGTIGMDKTYIPQIRVISVDHDRTTLAGQRLRKALDRHGMRDYPVRGVFCHLEAGRCGVPSGKVAVEVDGNIIWAGPEVTDSLAGSFCRGLPEFVRQQLRELGISGSG